jgi:hypothetical protein
MEYTWPQYLAFQKAVDYERNSRSVEDFSLLLIAFKGGKSDIDGVFDRYTKGM